MNGVAVIGMCCVSPLGQNLGTSCEAMLVWRSGTDRIWTDVGATVMRWGL